MGLLYKEHFGFRESPFNITPDPGFLYLSASHREALAQLSYGVKARRGFVVLTGEVGTGKTTLIHALLNELDSNTQTAFIFSYVGSPLDLLRYTCDEFGLRLPSQSLRDLHDYLILLNGFLLQKHQSGGNCALIIDEAQNLSAEVLESIRLLSNFETPKDKLLQILLVGQPELVTRLSSQELRQLRQRVTLRHHLRPLTLKESQEYVANRLRIAGGNPALFTPKALELMYAHSGGIPRVINVIGDNALLTAYALSRQQVDDAIIREVAEDLGLSVASSGVYPVISVDLAKEVSRNTLKGTHKDINIEGIQKTICESSARLNTTAATRDKANVIEFSQPPKIPLAERKIAVVTNLAVAARGNDKVSVAIFDALAQDLLEAMGPMASIVLEDHIPLLGHSPEDFPREKLAKLIEAVSQEILDPAMRERFRKAAYDRIRAA
jgi:general secretion pathway protein A